ncbi:MAG: TonB-dependent receptor [Rhodothermales bacterium]
MKTLPPLFLWMLFVGIAPLTHAQPTGAVEGTVRDADDGSPLPGVNVALLPTERGTVTGPDGRFELLGVAPGTYVLQASFIGYETVAQSVAVRPGEATRASLALTPRSTSLREVVVEGRAANLVGTAGAASEGRVGQAQLAARPLLRVGEVLETVPGMIVTQHSGSGKANQFFLRGFNLDHGTDFAASVEGVPINLPTHAHGQGYLDLNWLIPELIEEVAFAKGPQDVAAGDFATAGRAQIRLARRLDVGIAKAESGIDDYYGGLIADSSPLGGGDLLFAVRGRYYDGPWINPENSGLVSGVVKYSAGTASDGYSLAAMGYHHVWDATDQIARRAVERGQVSRLGTLDPSNGGTTGRYTLVGAWQQTTPGSGRTRANAYAAYYHLNLFSNFTYFLDNPTDGDQFEQADRRLYAGANVSHAWFSRWFGQQNTNTVGAALRHDQIFGVGLFNTRSRARIGTVRDDEVAETSVGAYLENETRWSGWLRTTLGVRGDVFRFDVASDREVNSGVETAFIASPKASLALGPWRDTEVYVNLGLGYHSNDARGTTIRVDPATGDAVDRVDPLVRTRGAEVGVRTAAISGLQSTLALWTIGLESELVFVGDAGGTEPSGASEHYGAEWTNHYDVTDWLDLTLDVALTESRFTEDDGEGTEIENSIGRIVSGGVYVGRATGWLGSVQLRHFGPRPLTADGRIEAEATTLLNVKAAYRFRRVAVALDVLNLTDAADADVSYFYASRLPGESADGVEDVHFHPVIPRTARLSVTWRF